MTKDTNSAIIRLVRNGGKAVDGAITVTSGGGTGGSDAAHDTFVKISNGTTEQTFATGSKVEAIGSKDATTGIKINGQDYTIKSGSKVSVTKNAAEKTTTITVDGTETTITDTDTHNALKSASLSGKTLTITGKDDDSVNVDLSSIDTDTKYTAGNGIAIDENNGHAISVKLKEGENNLEVTEAGLALKKALTVNSVKAGDTIVNTNGLTIGTGDKGIVLSTTNVSMGGQQIHNVAKGTNDNDAVNVAQLKKVSEAAASASQGWKLKTKKGNASDVKPGDEVEFDGDANIQVGNDGNIVSVTLKKQLTGIQSITGEGEGAGSISFADGGKVKVNDVTIEKGGKITGVAAGEVSSTSTDAINGSQLHAVATEAGKHTTLSNGKNTTVESTVKDGQTDYKVNVAGELTDITSVANGDSKINLNKDSIIISNGNKYFAITNSGIGMSYIGADYSAKSIMLGENGTTISGGLNVAGSKITGVAAGVADTDAVNVGQLNAAVQAGNTDTHIKAGEYGVGTDNKVNMQLVDKNGKDAGTVTITDVAKASDVGDVNNIASDIKNGEGHTTVVDAVNNLNNKVGDLQYSKVEKGDIADGDSTTTAIGKLDQKLTDVEATAAKHTKVEGGNNITVTNTAQEGEAANYKVELKKDIDVDTVKATTVTTGQTVMNNDGVKVGKDVSVTATAVTAGKTSISDEGVKVGDKTYINDKGLNANGQNITNVADGKVEKDSKDAINGGQLHQAKADINNRIDGVENQVISNSNRINQLGNRVNKVGAGAAALAALHPMDFDPDDKLTFSAGYGNYGGENAAAIGAYYRPDEKVMFSVGGTVGNGENMVNAGVSFALDRTNHVSNSRTALAREVIDLRGQLAVMGAKMAKMEKALGMLDETKTKLFPDIPANHWAYEYIAKLAGNGYIEGYPDGNFGGDRLMTRYEFAAMLYRAIENGAALEEKIIKEFEPELGRIRVDRISGEDGDRDKIERVRVNDTKGERDHYGNKLAK